MHGQPIQQLETAGWTPGCSVRVDADLAALRGGNYSVWNALVSFLAEYSGLVIWSTDDPHNPLWFDAKRAVEETPSQWVELYVERAGTALAPIRCTRT